MNTLTKPKTQFRDHFRISNMFVMYFYNFEAIIRESYCELFPDVVTCPDNIFHCALSVEDCTRTIRPAKTTTKKTTTIKKETTTTTKKPITTTKKTTTSSKRRPLVQLDLNLNLNLFKRN